MKVYEIQIAKMPRSTTSSLSFAIFFNLSFVSLSSIISALPSLFFFYLSSAPPFVFIFFYFSSSVSSILCSFYFYTYTSFLFSFHSHCRLLPTKTTNPRFAFNFPAFNTARFAVFQRFAVTLSLLSSQRCRHARKYVAYAIAGINSW